MKKLLCALIAGVMLLAMPLGILAEEAMVLNVQVGDITKVEDTPDNVVIAALEEAFGVELKYTQSAADTDALTVQIASGSIPDTFWDLTFSDYLKYVQQGILAEVPVEMIKENMPNLMAQLEKYVGGEDVFKYYAIEGKNYAVPVIWSLGTHARTLALREDWLNTVGIEELPKTLDDVENAIRLFTEGDPDGNGKDDTYGLSETIDNEMAMFDWVFGAYGVYPGIATEQDGKIVYGEVEPGAKDALTKLNDWYQKGYIDPDFVVNKTQNLREKWSAQQIGFIKHYWYQMIPAQAFSGGFFYEELAKQNPDGVLTVMGAPEGPDGQKGFVQMNPIFHSGLVFGAQMADNPEMMKKIMQIADATRFELDWLTLIHKGEEGVTFTKNEEGGYEWLAPYDDENERIKYGTDAYCGPYDCFNDYDTMAEFMTLPQYRELRNESEATCVGQYDIMAPVIRPVYTENWTKVKDFAMRNYIDFITGARSLDTFDDFVQEWKDLGGQAILDEAQTLYEQNF